MEVFNNTTKPDWYVFEVARNKSNWKIIAKDLIQKRIPRDLQMFSDILRKVWNFQSITWPSFFNRPIRCELTPFDICIIEGDWRSAKYLFKLLKNKKMTSWNNDRNQIDSIFARVVTLSDDIKYQTTEREEEELYMSYMILYDSWVHPLEYGARNGNLPLFKYILDKHKDWGINYEDRYV